MAQNLTVETMRKRMSQWPKIVAQFGKEAEQTKNWHKKQVELIAKYAQGEVQLDGTTEANDTFCDFVKLFGTKEGSEELIPEASEAIARLWASLDERGVENDEGNNDVDDYEKREFVEEIERLRQRSPNSDMNQYEMDRIAADVYLDMGLITQDEHNKSSVAETIEVLNSVPELTESQQIDFSERFVDKIINNEELFEYVPPKTLANAYLGTKKKIEDGAGDENVLRTRLAKLSQRMDLLSSQLKDQVGYYYVDTTNIADVYDGYNFMLDTRRADLDEQKDAPKIQLIDENKAALEKLITEYDEQWRLGKLEPEDAAKLSKHWDDLYARVGKANVSEDVLKLAQKYKFLDKDNNPIPQFLDSKGKETIDYVDGGKLNPDGRLARVIDLARHDVVMQNVGDVDSKIEDDTLEQELNDRIPFKLFEIDTADKVVQGALENPEQFTDQKYLNDFVAKLGQEGGEISDNGYEAAMDQQVNKTAGFLGRIKSKLGKGAKKIGNFFSKAFKPISDIDKRAKDRVEKSNVDKRKKRIEFFTRILKGFGSAFLYSAALTVVATAAATMAGVSLAVGVAAVGVVAAIGISAYQIYKWKKAQEAAGKPSDVKTMLKDKQMLTTLGTSGLAAVGLVFGAAAMPMAAMACGYGALALGSGSNAVQMYKDGVASGMKKKEAIAWSLANIVAVVGGGFAGRATANAGIQAFNEANPNNEIFQNKHVEQGVRHVESTEQHTVYTQDALDNAERICKYWYADDPQLLQERVDMINAYNAEHGTNIDPYRAIMINADAGNIVPSNHATHVDGGGIRYAHGNYNVINTDVWLSEHGFSPSDGNIVKNMFAGGQVDPRAIDLAMRMDGMISATNEVGVVSHGDAPHYDGVLDQNTVDRNGTPVFNTYADGENVFTTETVTTVNEVPYDIESFTPVDVPWTMGMYGVHYPRTVADIDILKDRIGAKADRIIEYRKKTYIDPTPVPPVPPKPPVPPVPPKPDPKEDDDQEIDDLLLDEYKIIHGRSATPSEATMRAYADMVRADFADEKPEVQARGFKQYMWDRMSNFYESLDSRINAAGIKKGKELKTAEGNAINETRQDIWKSNADIHGMTLQNFQEAMNVSTANDHSGGVLRVTQDPRKGPVVHKRKDKKFGQAAEILKKKGSDARDRWLDREQPKYDEYLRLKKIAQKRPLTAEEIQRLKFITGFGQGHN